jgi:putative hydrolase of the HAD superfamily
MIKSVIFDLGGVLLRTMDQGPRQALAGRLGVSLHDLYHAVFSSESARLATLGMVTTDAHWEAVRVRFGISPADLPGVIEQFWEGDRLDYSLVRSIRSLHRRCKTALLSNAWDDIRAVLEGEWKIAGVFDELIISAEVGLAKPDHRIYLLALERLGVMPGEAVFLDDFGENVDGARWIGMHAIQFRSRHQAMSELKRMLDEDPLNQTGAVDARFLLEGSKKEKEHGSSILDDP